MTDQKVNKLNIAIQAAKENIERMEELAKAMNNNEGQNNLWAAFDAVENNEIDEQILKINKRLELVEMDLKTLTEGRDNATNNIDRNEYKQLIEDTEKNKKDLKEEKLSLQNRKNRFTKPATSKFIGTAAKTTR
ncbi:MAG: hypothetical protein FWC61_02865 [Proteobacteria bacterium]|nr:hypothetical protein [Pseudomonadota bacterium]